MLQIEEPSPEYSSSIHAAQVALPVDEAKLPAEQITQSASASCAEVEVAESVKYLPTPQLVQDAVPVEAAYLPLEQITQSASAS